MALAPKSVHALFMNPAAFWEVQLTNIGYVEKGLKGKVVYVEMLTKALYVLKHSNSASDARNPPHTLSRAYEEIKEKLNEEAAGIPMRKRVLRFEGKVCSRG